MEQLVLVGLRGVITLAECFAVAGSPVSVELMAGVGSWDGVESSERDGAHCELALELSLTLTTASRRLLWACIAVAVFCHAC